MSSPRAVSPIPTLFEVVARSEAGPTRYCNEDRALGSRSLGLCLVADGMGGSCSGEAAPILLVDVLYEQRALWSGSRVHASSDWSAHPFVTAVKLANMAILDATERERRLRGMGTTVVAVVAVMGGVLIAHVGDSRCYRIRGGTFEAMTRDHSLRNAMLDATPALSDEQLHDIPPNVITRALGMQPHLEVEVRFEPILPRDLFLLCSDGITNTLGEEVVAEMVLHDQHDLDLAARRLIAAACAREASDDLTVVLGRWG